MMLCAYKTYYLYKIVKELYIMNFKKKLRYLNKVIDHIFTLFKAKLIKIF